MKTTQPEAESVTVPDVPEEAVKDHRFLTFRRVIITHLAVLFLLVAAGFDRHFNNNLVPRCFVVEPASSQGEVTSGPVFYFEAEVDFFSNYGPIEPDPPTPSWFPLLSRYPVTSEARVELENGSLAVAIDKEGYHGVFFSYRSNGYTETWSYYPSAGPRQAYCLTGPNDSRAFFKCNLGQNSMEPAFNGEGQGLSASRLQERVFPVFSLLGEFSPDWKVEQALGPSPVFLEMHPEWLGPFYAIYEAPQKNTEEAKRLHGVYGAELTTVFLQAREVLRGVEGGSGGIADIVVANENKPSPAR